MCGIVGGWWSKTPRNLDSRVNSALVKISHRGPNDKGVEQFAIGNGSVTLAHTRLSILELSDAGHQPMKSQCGRYHIVFNGEIYNYKELGSELTKIGHSFRSNSDTEVLLAAWAEWHVDCLIRLEGMFSFVIYDNKCNTLSCVRDAFGIKPFLYDLNSDRFLFASEQAALLAIRNEKAQVNWQRSYDYLVHGNYDSAEDSFVNGVKHLMPGHWLEVQLSEKHSNEPKCWWKPEIKKSSELTFKQATEAVREQFLQNIRLHLRSDVPLGAALSGGIDSSAVVCAMRHLEPEIPINTFSYIASGTGLSEEEWVDRVNSFSNAIPHKVSATGLELANDLDTIIQTQGEPFGSTSLYAQYKVFQLAREHDVTVTLDGQGADELLAGYNGYPGQRVLSLLEKGEILSAHKFIKQWSQWPGRSYKQALLYLGRLILPEGIYARTRKSLGRDFQPSWLNIDMLKEGGVCFNEHRPLLLKENRGLRVLEQLARSLQVHGLPHLLRHGDRNSMQFSVESRVPFLTLPMANLLLSLPENYLISDTGETKCVFRAAMRGIVPDEVLDRKDKIGFATPEQDWLLSIAEKVRGWLQSSEQIPFLNRHALLNDFDAIVDGKKAFSLQVWRWINFVRWYEITINDK